MSLQRREWLAMVTVFLVSLLMRVNYAWPALSGKIDFFMGDDDDYYALALSLVQHGTLGTPNPTAYRMPFFPLFLAFWHWLLGPSPYAALPVLLVLLWQRLAARWKPALVPVSATPLQAAAPSQPTSQENA